MIFQASNANLKVRFSSRAGTNAEVKARPMLVALLHQMGNHKLMDVCHTCRLPFGLRVLFQLLPQLAHFPRLPCIGFGDGLGRSELVFRAESVHNAFQSRPKCSIMFPFSLLLMIKDVAKSCATWMIAEP